jgi:Ferritin-like
VSSRLRSQLVWRTPEPRLAVRGFMAPAADSAQEKAKFTVQVAPREQAIRLLWIGAEVEHALMAQYLYAAYTINLQQPEEAMRQDVLRWRNTILAIAREEMGHLATVENLLTLIGGPLHFDREDFPIVDPDLWPFPFELEPLSKLSLAKYVLAETPAEDVLVKLGLKDEIDAIKLSLKVGGDLTVHRVGLIYDKVNQLFTANPMPQGPDVPPYTDQNPSIATIDIQESAEKYQVTPAAWGLGYADLLIETAHDRTSAQSAIHLVSEQGEGSSVPSDLDSSHFGRFLKIYREFPDSNSWRPSHHVAINPTTKPGVNDPTRTIDGDACNWAELSNLRYHMLLLYLHHSFLIEAPSTGPSRSPRGSLISWTFGEMYNLRSLSEILMGMPLQPGSELNAGPPFEMPYTLALPPREADRWRTHRDLLNASITLVGRMLEHERERDLEHKPNRSAYLQALLTSDTTTLEQVNALVGA